MDLNILDEQLVRIVLKDGEIFEGECIYDSAEYCMHEFGREKPALEIDRWLFFEDEIAEAFEISEKPVYLWMSKPAHRMRLHSKPFDMMERGEKTIELRLYDPKRKALKIGDIIRFENTEDEEEILYVRVEKLHVFASFAELYRTLPLTECGYTQENVQLASPKDMDAYYSEEEQKRYGVVGICVSLL